MNYILNKNKILLAHNIFYNLIINIPAVNKIIITKKQNVIKSKKMSTGLSLTHNYFKGTTN